jgi:undecaprenyl diphosphate synthase
MIKSSILILYYDLSSYVFMQYSPSHIAIIPDGNRRWAREKNLPEFEGHRIASEKILPDLLQAAADAGVQYFTFWALSTENLVRRPTDELQNLFRLLRIFLTRQVKKLKEKGIRLRVIGDIEKLPEDIQTMIRRALVETADNTKLTFIVGLNYGGRDEIARAVEKMIATEPKKENWTKDTIHSFLDTADIPDPDFIIRTGGEKRISGFLLWQSEYAEFAFIDTYFPDLTKKQFQYCISDFTNRTRRFGS